MLKINMKNTKKEIFKSFDKNLIYKEMVKILSLHEIKIYQARVDRTNKRMQRYEYQCLKPKYTNKWNKFLC